MYRNTDSLELSWAEHEFAITTTTYPGNNPFVLLCMPCHIGPYLVRHFKSDLPRKDHRMPILKSFALYLLLVLNKSQYYLLVSSYRLFPPNDTHTNPSSARSHASSPHHFFSSSLPPYFPSLETSAYPARLSPTTAQLSPQPSLPRRAPYPSAPRSCTRPRDPQARLWPRACRP